MIQLTLTLKMTTAQVVETSVTVNNNSPIQDYVHPDDQTQPTFEMLTILPQFSKIFKYNYVLLNDVLLSRVFLDVVETKLANFCFAVWLLFSVFSIFCSMTFDDCNLLYQQEAT